MVTVALDGWKPTIKVGLHDLRAESPDKAPHIISQDTQVFIMYVLSSESRPARIN